MNVRNTMTPKRRKADKRRLIMHCIICALGEFPNFRPHPRDREVLVLRAAQHGTRWKITKKEVRAVLKMKVEKALSIPTY